MVYVPNVIDIIPEMITAEDTSSIREHKWDLNRLKAIADIKIVGHKLYINSDKVTFENGVLYITLETEQIYNAKIVEGKEELEQECALATIWQKGNDPLALQDGIRWSEVMLGEINVVQLINDITEAVSDVTTAVTVTFSTVTAKDGSSYLTYKIQTVG